MYTAGICRMFRFYNLTMEHNDTKWHHNQLCDLWVKLKKCHACEISFMGVTQGGKESPPPVTLTTYQKSSACINFPCHSKPSRPFPTYCRYFHIVPCSQFISNSLTWCSNHRRINNTIYPIRLSNTYQYRIRPLNYDQWSLKCRYLKN